MVLTDSFPFCYLMFIKTNGVIKMFYDLICIDCNAEFEPVDLEEGKCPQCGSTHFDYYDDVEEGDE